ncbi:hypothetical protein SEA_NUEVOMUNDO_7 [Mycobacterium phage NuevoMundo]|uniref:Uncharacterized protein n=1 Tax=Mycobacterium phage Dandelion TaxID=1074305 RepID=G1JVV9_9CAUD|nr:hypothetical protein DANDELION_7 [Mycobacterium phage Dandelion]AVJ48285.1 hypothetical protein SEA_NUEVOMUNDO_7 [Mycobacterium phage NuevoMundo]AVJ48521.1 hypothetical protein SEA_PIER_7 [Mycobacterium phage Pier]QAY06229.1 hypothetical protein SEA_FRAYBELL_8 [Mycobacterium phage FrayBell]QAY26467.1 hypothetical protein SEA_SPECKS_8 [Mycobacterium phage Specks]QED11199.1 hypothetical protein SEA_LOLAVINCA_8 [Mycobacterium phage LolaVinca]QPL13345.1 hypothetical protein SEA_STEPHANIEG_7 [M
MTSELRDVLTEALVEASYDYWYEKQTLGVDSRGKDVCAYLVDRLLSLPSVAVIQLPEPDDDHGDGIAFWTAQEVGVADGMVVARFDPGNEAIYYEPSEAWETVAALAAAAVVAEGEDK